MALAMLLATESVWGQGRRSRRRRGPEIKAILERSAPVINLFKRADEGISTQDWKLVLDSLQRILEQPVHALLPVETDSADPAKNAKGIERLESSRDRAMRLLATLPAHVLESYRLLYDGPARALLDKARDSGSIFQLQEIVDRYLLTNVGDQAASLLAVHYLDTANPSASLAVLDDIDRYCIDTDLDRRQLAVQRAVAWRMSGAQRKARHVAHSAGDAADAGLDALRQTMNDDWRYFSGDAFSESEEVWAMLGGGTARRGKMPAVSPELQHSVPWRVTLPNNDPDWWKTHYLADRSSHGNLPVASAVVSGGRVFVKSDGQVLAFDVESLEHLWETAPALDSVDLYRLGSPLLRANNEAERISNRFSDDKQLLLDYTGGSLTATAGSVYSIDWSGSSTGLTGTNSLFSGSVRNRTMRQGNMLVALDEADGSVVWARGRSGQEDDQLGTVNFLAPPIGINGELWAPVAKGGDLFCVTLHPETGDLLRKLLLCSVNQQQFHDRRHEAIFFASDGANVYVPTHAGVLLAVDVERFALRWALRYPRIPRPNASTAVAPASWICCSPVVAGDVLLAAPMDSNQLLAVDRWTGELRWSQSRPPGARYILGVTENRVWLGGSTLTCLDVADGGRIWQRPEKNTLAATGRAALSGDTIFVPTEDSLAAYDAESGELLDQRKLPDHQLALGNLVCIASALFSVDTNELRKFPDLTLSYPKQLDRNRADPTDVQTAIRLAWMELLRGEPQRAFALLESIPDQPQSAGRPAFDVTRLRVDALLGMAQNAETDDEIAIAHLEEAISLTDIQRDKLRAGIALAARLRKTGEADQAYEMVWELGLSPAGDGFVTVQPRLRNQARRVVARYLGRLERDLTATQLQTVARMSRQAVAQAVERLADPRTREQAARKLKHIAALDDAGGGGQAALCALAEYERKLERFERSEQYYRQAIRVNRVAKLTAQAMVGLTEQYLQDDQQLFLEASRLLERLELEYIGASGTIGGHLAENISALASEFQQRSAEGAAASIVRMRSAMSPDNLLFAQQSPVFEETEMRVFDYRYGDSEAARLNRLMFGAPSVVSAFDVADGEQRWTADLRLLGSLRNDASQLIADDPFIRTHPKALCDGQVAVINGAEGLFGLGVLTGRRLWSIPYEDPGTLNHSALRNRLVAVSDGVLVCCPRRGVLQATSLVSADDILWERVYGGEKVDAVFVRDGLCITADAGWQRASAFDLQTGEQMATCTFDQTSRKGGPIPLVYEDGFLIGPVAADKIGCFDARTGEQNWTYTTTGDLTWIFKPGKGFVGVCSRGGEISMLDAFDGVASFRTDLPEVAGGLAEGVFCQDSILLLAVRTNSRGDDEPTLISVDSDTGDVRWRREELGTTGAPRFMLWDLLRLAENVMPMPITEAEPNADAFRSKKGLIGMIMIDKQTGQDVGPKIMSDQAATMAEKLTGEFGLWPGWLVLSTEQGLLQFRLDGSIAEGSTPDHHRSINQ